MWQLAFACRFTFRGNRTYKLADTMKFAIPNDPNLRPTNDRVSFPFKEMTGFEKLLAQNEGYSNRFAIYFRCFLW